MKGKVTLFMVIFLTMFYAAAIDSHAFFPQSDASILAITEDGDFLWIGTNYGLTKLHKSTGEIIEYIDSIPDTEGKEITSLTFDAHGNLWVGTDGSGVAVYDGTNWMNYTVGSGLSYYNVTALTADNSGNMWVGTSSGLSHFDGENWSSYKTHDSGLPKSNILSLACDADGTVWIGTDDGGVAKFDGENWEVYNKTNSDLPYDDVNALTCGSDGCIWMGTNFGLAKYDGSNWITYTKSNSELPNDNISQLYCDESGNVWVLTQHFYTGYGLAMFSGENSVEYNKKNSGIIDQMLQCIYCDDQGNIWIGTDGGLQRYDGESWELINTGGLYYMGTWESGSGMPTPRAFLSSAVFKGKIYVFGGYSGIRGNDPVYENTNQEYDPATDTWKTKSSMSTCKGSTCACTVGDKIYVIGGWNYLLTNTGFKTVEIYDPATDTWSTGTNMPTARKARFAAAVVNDKIYAIGGGLLGQAMSTVEEYDPVTDTWTTKADMPTKRCLLSASVVDGKIYAIGGAISAIRPTVEEYDPATDTWTTKADMPTQRKGLSTSVVNGKIYAIGGWPGSTTSTIVEEYDPATDSWVRKADMLAEKGGHTSAAVGGKIYVIGGGRGAFDTVDFAGNISGGVQVFSPEYTDPTAVENVTPSELTLSPNYPNPFNPTTTITYNLDQPGMVNLVIYDLLGRKVETLVDEIKTPGNYAVTWNAEGFASGVYFYRLDVGDSKVLTQKMMLVK